MPSNTDKTSPHATHTPTAPNPSTAKPETVSPAHPPAQSRTRSIRPPPSAQTDRQSIPGKPDFDTAPRNQPTTQPLPPHPTTPATSAPPRAASPPAGATIAIG